MEKLRSSPVDSKGNLIDQTGLFVKRLITKRIRSSKFSQLHYYPF